ncbi:PHA/PHB synthase family protein [Janthinobacterium sp.]|uniref:PHA/PHB synthase family protein n=1 Tax=Janthinobacterium sp. TaxID=1871054 RepID=UPI00293D4357|nr:alpha/beta fold hydrolase [Janthinobacterium sp.]
MHISHTRQAGMPVHLRAGRRPVRGVAHLETLAPGWNDEESPAIVDRILQAAIARATHGISPISVALAYTDWAMHLATAPGKWRKLLLKAIRKEARLAAYGAELLAGRPCGNCIAPLPQDKRFSDPSWQRWPFNLIYQGFLLNQQWWHNAVTGISGVSAHHEHVVSFVTRQLLDMVSPVNFIATNPEVLTATVREGGLNFLRGAANFLADLDREAGKGPPPGAEAFQPGRQVALTPGHVIYRNRLIELIQYTPKTAQVRAEPVLIVPAWIMKYYILDLAPHNSLVNYLVERGHTVFMISWHNPSAADRDIGMDDYLTMGVLEACKVVQTVVPERKINAVGYCLGGTVLAIGAAYLNEAGQTPFNSLTLLAAQTDFSEAGELSLFIDESQIAYLENLMWRQGYLDTRQMAGAFQLLRSNDLIWSRMVHDYLLGQRAPLNELMAWNADTTRMPYRMHSEYLRRLFLNNDLFAGRYRVDGKSVALSDIDVPIFAVATETDHVAPWHSVYKLNLVADTELTFVLTSGGHNAGIVSEPGNAKRSYKTSCWQAEERYVDPDRWYLDTPTTQGSWWPLWADWLSANSSPALTAPPGMGAAAQGYAPMQAAPGSYVLER